MSAIRDAARRLAQQLPQAMAACTTYHDAARVRDDEEHLAGILALFGEACAARGEPRSEASGRPTYADDRRERVHVLLTAACAAQHKGCRSEVQGHLRAAQTVIEKWSDHVAVAAPPPVDIRLTPEELDAVIAHIEAPTGYEVHPDIGSAVVKFRAARGTG